MGWCDRDRATRGRRCGHAFGVRDVHDARRRCSTSARPDLVDIVTPPRSHRALVGEVAHRIDMPMICQKALAPTYEDAVALVESAEAAGVPLVVHENFRWQPWYREAKRLLDAGHLGTPHSIAFRLRPGDGQGPRAYLDRQPYFQRMPRFLVFETAIHWIDTFRFLMGEVTRDHRAPAPHQPRHRRRGCGLPRLRVRQAARPACSTATAPTTTWRAIRAARWARCGSKAPPACCGSTATRACGGSRITATERRARLRRAATMRSSAAAACEALQRHVVAHLTHGAPLENRGREYLVNLRVQEAAYRSARDRAGASLPAEEAVPHGAAPR